MTKMNQEVKVIVQELQALARRKPLPKPDLTHAKELMLRLRAMGFTNKEVSELTDGGWSEVTVKLYTRGAKTVDLTWKKDLTDLLKELVSRNIWLNDVELALSVVRTLNAKGVGLDEILRFLLNVDESQIDLKRLMETHGEMVKLGLTVEEMEQIQSYRKKLDGLGITSDGLETICRVTVKYGGYKNVLEAIDRYGKLKEIEDDYRRIREDKINLDETILDLQNKRNGLEGDIKKLQEDNIHFKNAVELCKILVSDYGLNIAEIEIIKKCCEKYGDLMAILDAIETYGSLKEMQSSIRELSIKKTALESRIGELEEQNSRISGIESRLSEAQRTLDMIDQKMRTSRDLSIILDLVARPDKIVDPLPKVLAVIFTMIKSSEIYIEKRGLEMARASTLKNKLHEVGTLLGECMTDELRRTRREDEG